VLNNNIEVPDLLAGAKNTLNKLVGEDRIESMLKSGIEERK
jgi:hypothetical protein